MAKASSKATTNPEAPKESNEDRFKRIARRRTQMILKGMQSLGKCAGPGYAFSEPQVEKMLSALELQLAGLRQVFMAKSSPGFGWDDE